jgi:hypothetical protein
MRNKDIKKRRQHFLTRQTDGNDVPRMDQWLHARQQLQRMELVARDTRPVAARLRGRAPARTLFSGVSWQLIGPQPLRIDAEQNFQGRGPDSGEVVDIVIDPTGATDQTIFIATNNGGVWKTVDGGATWQPKTDFMPSMSMGALALDPVDHLIVYAGTGNDFDGGNQQIRGAGIYKSIDSGETWVQLSEALFVGREIIRIVIPAPNILLVATNNGLFRSVDGGVSFGSNAPAFNDGNAIVAGTITDLALDKLDPATVYASVQSIGILVSTDGGITFPLASNLFAGANGAPTPPHIDWISFAQAASDPSVMYALVTDSGLPVGTPAFNGLYRSDNKGANWNHQPGADARAADNGGLQNEYDVTLAVDPRNSNRVCIGFQELYLSLDGGLNFGTPAVSANQVHFDNHVIVFSPHAPADPNKPTPFYVGNDGGVSRNNDGSNAGWDLLNESIATNLLLAIDIGRNSAANRAVTFGACQDTGIAETKPGFTGLDWHEGVNGDGRAIVVDPQNPQKAYGRDDDSYVVTSNGGASWIFPPIATTHLPLIPNPPPGSTDSAGHPLGVDPNNPAIVFVKSTGATLFRSIDSGVSFALMQDFTLLSAGAGRISAFANTAQDSKILMIGCGDGTVFRTANADQGAAATWTPLTVTNAPAGPVKEVTAIAIDPTDVKIAAVTYGARNNPAAGALSQHVFFSADVTTTSLTDIGGTANGDPDANVPDLPVHTVIFDPSTTPHSIIIGCDIEVLRTTDSGATWHIYGAGLPNTDCTSLVADYSLSPAPPLIRLGTYGRGVYELSRLSGAKVFLAPNLAFGDIAQGASSNSTFDIFNIGDATLTITSINDPSANPMFSLVAPPPMPLDIAPGDKATITISFAPTAPGKQITMFSVNSNDPTHPLFGVPVSGFATFAGPQVTGIIPAQGPAAGGTAVKIHGLSLTGATAVNFGALAATGLTVDSDTQISAVTPAGGGQVDVTVVTPAGTTAVNTASHFTYLGATVSVTGLNPSEGPETGGTSVVITGTGLAGATQVLFAGFAASGFTQDSDSQITAISPAGTGVVDVLVATIAGTSAVSAADKFRYTAPGGGVATGVGGTSSAFAATVGGAPGADDNILNALADILRTGTDPQVLEAQRILLRRIALEGNIIDSRIPAPKNITEVGGYVNLLGSLGETDTRTQMLASAMGVAGPATPAGLMGDGPTLAFINLPNDRPPGAAQATFTTAITVRSDMADALTGALQRIHGFGCALPLYTPPRVLPIPTPGQMLQPDLLEILGRVLQVAPRALLLDPATDAVALARLAGDPPDRWQLVTQELDGQSRIAIASWIAYQATDANLSTTPPASRRYIPIAPILADAGWYSSQPFAAPSSSVSQGSLPRLINVTGLTRGNTRLGDELLLLYSRSAVMGSALAGMLSWVWNGMTFVPSERPSAIMHA